MKHFTTISIIYNPKSTGSGEKLARELADQLASTSLKGMIKLLATKRAGHGEELAYKLAKASQHPLIISSSGDGGYHEVINGVMRAQRAGATPTTCLVPAGNANDHYKNLPNTDVVKRITTADTSQIDLLRIKARRAGQDWERYAHSYIGIGLTPKVGQELNKVDLNPLNEPWVVLRALWRLGSIKILVDGQLKKYDSVVFSNVAKMSKILTLSDKADMFDGKFEIAAFPSRSKLELLGTLFRAATAGLNTHNQASTYSFQAIKPLAVQLDGEVFTIDADSNVTVESSPLALTCLI